MHRRRLPNYRNCSSSSTFDPAFRNRGLGDRVAKLESVRRVHSSWVYSAVSPEVGKESRLHRPQILNRNSVLVARTQEAQATKTLSAAHAVFPTHHHALCWFRSRRPFSFARALEEVLDPVQHPQPVQPYRATIIPEGCKWEFENLLW